MSSHRPRVAATVSLFLSYLLILSVLPPFAVAHSYAPSLTPALTQAPVRYRDGEILVRFREGTSAQDKDATLAKQGARGKRQLKGESRFEKIELGKIGRASCRERV